MNLANAIKGTNDLKSIQSSIKVTKLIKNFSFFILIVDIFVICAFGEEEKVKFPNSLDQIFKRKYPNLYSSMTSIGLRTNMKLEGFKHDLNFKFFTIVSFFLLSIYLQGNYESEMSLIKEENEFSESNYKMLFEWKK
jgi:hypothetical protein